MESRPPIGKPWSEMTPAERVAEKERVRRLADALGRMAGMFPSDRGGDEIIRDIRRKTIGALRAGL